MIRPKGPSCVLPFKPKGSQHQHAMQRVLPFKGLYRTRTKEVLVYSKPKEFIYSYRIHLGSQVLSMLVLCGLSF